MVTETKSKSKPLEKQIQAAIVKWLKRNGFKADVITSGLYGNSGIADILAWKDGVPLAFEVKRDPKYKPTPLQQEWLDDAVAHGVIAKCVSSVAEVEAIVIWAEEGGYFER